jgi:hypothetical protein
MGEIVNLRRARKRRRREREETIASANRLARGVGKATLAQTRAERERADQALAAHRRDADNPEA